MRHLLLLVLLSWTANVSAVSSFAERVAIAKEIEAQKEASDYLFGTFFPSVEPSLGVIAVFIAPVAFSQETADVEQLIKHMPKAVSSYISRRVECNHWGGEEAYNHERAKQIEKAVKPLRCDRLDSDEKDLLAKYQNEPKIIKAIGAAKELYL